MIPTCPKILWHSFFIVSTPFLLVMAAAAAAAADEPKSCFDAAKNHAASCLGVGATFFHSSSVRAKTPMGLHLFEVRFFFGEKFTKFDLALKQVIRNRSKVFWGLPLVFITIWTKDFFCAKSLMETPLDSIFFTQFFFPVRVPGIFGRSDQKKIRYDWRSSYMIWSERKILIFFKSLMGTKLELIFIKHIFFSFTVPGPGRYPNQNLLRYDQRSFYMIRYEWSIFLVSKVLWEH